MRKSLVYLLLFLLVNACGIKKNNEASPSGFLKIYNESSYSNQYTPLDIEQTSDGGFLILSSTVIATSAFPGIYIMKIDKDGKLLSTKLLSGNYVAAVPNLIKNGTDFYIVCMSSLNLGTYILKLNEAGDLSENAYISNMKYPLSAEFDLATSHIILQHYNKDDLQTNVSKISVTGTVAETRYFSIGTGGFDVQQPIIDHLTGKGKKYPFLSGHLSGNTFYFNGFYNYTLSLCMFDFSWPVEDDPAAVQGYRDERCINSVLPLGGNEIATSRYAYGNNYIIPSATVPTTSAKFTDNTGMGGFLIPELTGDAGMCLKEIRKDGQKILLYASTTKSGQVALYAYDAAGGQLLGSQNLGTTNPYTMANIIQTSDGGIAVLATTQVAGRFSRIAVFKMGKEELKW